MSLEEYAPLALIYGYKYMAISILFYIGLHGVTPLLKVVRMLVKVILFMDTSIKGFHWCIIVNVRKEYSRMSIIILSTINWDGHSMFLKNKHSNGVIGQIYFVLSNLQCNTCMV